MEAAVGILKAAVFLLSAWGLGFVVYKRLKISVYFTPICTMAGVSLLLYAGGTAGYLEQTAYAVCAGGLAGCAYFVWLLIKRKIRLRAPGLFGICFGVTALVFFRLILNLKLLHYDNFSHWAVIVKYLLSSGRFPAIDTDIVVFLDYPPGSSVFIYYVCLFLGRSQGMMLLAQNSMIFACFLAVFGIVEERRRFLLYSFLGMGCAMLSYLNLTIRVNNLLVDFLLPLLAMASIAASYHYRNHVWKSCFFSVFTLGYLGIVKNTGLIFAGFAYLWYLWTVFHWGKTRLWRKCAAAVISFAGMVLPFVIWKFYTGTALAGYEGKFSIGGAGGNPEYIPADESLYGEIIARFFKEAVNLSDRAVQAFLLCNLAAAAAVIFARLWLKRRWNLWKILILADVMAGLYYAGMLLLYLYSMPMDEALRLAGFERYACSIMTLSAGVLFMSATVDMEHSFAVSIDEAGPYRAYSSPAAKRYYQYGVLATFVVALNFLYSEFNGLAAIRRDYDESLPGRAEKIIGDRWYESGAADGQRYLVAATDRNSQVTDGEVRYVSRYFLYSPNVDVTDNLDIEKLENAIENYDFIVVLEDEAVDEELIQVYGGVFSREGIYQVKEPGISG